jgi:hypothetical protein
MTRIRLRSEFAAIGQTLAVAFVALPAVACGSAQQERARVAEIQRAADHRIELIRAESERQAAEAQRQIAKLKADLAAKNDELDRALRGRPHGDDGLANERRALEDRGRTALARLDEEASDIAARTSSLAKAARAEIERELAKASASRKYLEDDLRELNDATRQTLSELSNRIDRRLAEIEETLKNARRKLK